MDFLELSKKRFTAKKYDPSKKISAENIAKLKEILQLTPSSINSQPWVFIFGSSDEAKKRIRPAVMDFNWPRTDTCSHFVVIAVRDHIDEKFMREVIEQECKDGRIVSDESAKEMLAGRMFFVDLRETTGEMLNWEKKQAYSAMTTLMYGAASLGIDSTPIEGFDEAQLDKILNLDNYGLHSVLIVALGYDAEDDHNATRPKSRLPLSRISFDLP